MNIALSAVIIFILLLPPVVFYVSFLHGRFQKGWPRLTFLESMIVCAVFSISAHAIGIMIIERNVRFDLLFMLLSGDSENLVNLYSNKEIENHLLQFVGYNCIQLMIALLLGKFARWIVKNGRLHSSSETLRLYNKWWYLFNGYELNGKNSKNIHRPFDIVFIDVLVNTNAGSLIYSGYLSDFICHGEMLDRIYLSKTRKRVFNTVQKNEKSNIMISKISSPQAIKGDLMSISFKDIINMNLQFVTANIRVR